jgi:hypothetical protein
MCLPGTGITISHGHPHHPYHLILVSLLALIFRQSVPTVPSLPMSLPLLPSFSAGLPVPLPLPGLGVLGGLPTLPLAATLAPAAPVVPVIPPHAPSPYVLLKNMFDPAEYVVSLSLQINFSLSQTNYICSFSSW